MNRKFLLLALALTAFALLTYLALQKTVRHVTIQGTEPVDLAILDADKTFSAFRSGFPPDPGPENDRTIAGVDADHDGVRDDVQRWIYARYRDFPLKMKALRKQAL